MEGKTFAQMYEIITHKLPKRIKLLREIHNYTQEFIAEELGMSQTGYGNLERGVSIISLDKIEIFCKIYKINIDEFFEFDLIGSNLLRAEAQIAFAQGHKISHNYFLHGEFVKLNADNKMQDGNGNILNKMDFWLLRGTKQFDDGWFVIQ